MVQGAEKLLVMLNKLEEIRGRTRLQKIVYLLMERNVVDFAYDFIPYYYGPYAQDLQIEINLLEAANLIEVRPIGGFLYVHRLTEKGKATAEEIEQKMEEDEVKKLSKVSNKYKKRSTNSLIMEAKKLAGMSS